MGAGEKMSYAISPQRLGDGEEAIRGTYSNSENAFNFTRSCWIIWYSSGLRMSLHVIYTHSRIACIVLWCSQHVLNLDCPAPLWTYRNHGNRGFQ